jgi:hypothetical protein
MTLLPRSIKALLEHSKNLILGSPGRQSMFLEKRAQFGPGKLLKLLG